MKASVGFAMFLSLAAAAQAKPAPVEPPAKTLTPEDTAISVGAAGALLESDYFRAPQESSVTGRVFPCRLQLRVFEKTQIAQACR